MIEVMVVIGFGAFSQLAYLLPDWLIVLLAVELWAGWGMLQEFGLIELAQTQLKTAENALRKLFEMIPRYKPE